MNPSGFRYQLEASHAFSHTEELWYNEAVCEWQYKCALTPVGLALEWGIAGHINAKLFSWTEHSCSW